MKANSLKVVGHTISFFDVNPDEKTTLLFIHGNSMSKQLFQNQLKSKVFCNFRMISFDLIGFGESSHSNQPSEEYNVPYYAELTSYFIKKLNLENVFLIGHSLGGHIAIEFSGRYEDEIKGFIAVATPPLGIPADIPAAFLPNPVANLLFKAALTKDEVIEFSNNVANSIHQDIVVASIDSSHPIVREKIGESIINQNYLDEIAVLNDIEMPYALVLGSKDKLCNQDYFKKYPFNNQWRGKLNIIKRGSHNPFIDQPDEINEVILAFLN
jgi:pimeloyl-ACP methyl ester carboxylesterase